MFSSVYSGPRSRERSGFFCSPQSPDSGADRVVSLGDGIELRWSLKRDLRCSPLGGFRLHNLSCRIVDRTERSVIGYIDARKLSLPRGTAFSGAAFFDFCDSISPELSQFAEQVVHHHLFEITLAMERGPVYYLERIEVKASHKGRRLGVRAFSALRDALFAPSRTTACFLQPSPLQFSNSIGLTETTRARYQAAKKKLIDHYRKHWNLRQLGPRSKYWYVPYTAGPFDSGALSHGES